MMSSVELDFAVTDGEIAVNNLESARQNAWNRLRVAPQPLDIAEDIVELESLAAQLIGDLEALDRLSSLIQYLDAIEPDSSQAALINAHVASVTHRFSDARFHIDKAAAMAELPNSAKRLSLAIDQACGNRLDAVLETRQLLAKQSALLGDLVPLGALLAELGKFDEADEVYERALRHYRETTPFGIAWLCFQRGVLWGELVPVPEPSQAEYWYSKAIDYLPTYVRARIHLAEICLERDQLGAADALLTPVMDSVDPEVNWRLADVLRGLGNADGADAQMKIARVGFDSLLDKYLLAFADHGAGFYLGSGNDYERALRLARANLENRPTLRAFELAHKAAVQAGDEIFAFGLVREASIKWGSSDAFRSSSLVTANHDIGSLEGLC